MLSLSCVNELISLKPSPLSEDIAEKLHFQEAVTHTTPIIKTLPKWAA